MSAYNNWFFESRISKNTCESFIKEYYKQDQSQEGVIGIVHSKIDKNKRVTNVCCAEPNSPLGLLLFNHILIANTKANWNFDIDLIEGVQIGEYPVGGHYDWHTDQDVYYNDGSDIQRKLSLSLFLSDPDTYEGGDLLLDGIETPIIKKQGSIIIFPSSLKHTVTPVTSGVRYSAVTWARGPQFR